jgi:hypothetical protein
MIVWAFAAQCHTAELQPLSSQLTETVAVASYPWNRKPRVDPSTIKRVLDDFSVTEQAHASTRSKWGQVSRVSQAAPVNSARTSRIRRFFPGYRSESDVSWTDMSRFGSNDSGSSSSSR